MKSELKPYKVISKTNILEQIDDPFVQEIVGLWKNNDRIGKLFYTENENTEVVSFILLEMNDKEWTIRGTWTHPDYRKQGLSTQLLKNITADFRYSGETCIWVNITPGTEELYKKNGFVIYGQRLDTDPPMSVGVYSRYDEESEKRKFTEKFPNHELFEKD